MNTNKNAFEIKNYSKKLIELLNEQNVPCYIWHEATTDSIYIRFEDNRIGSIRIADHEGRSRLKYKFNLRCDLRLKQPKWQKDNGTWRYYCPFDKYKEMVQVIKQNAERVKTYSESKYEYTIPKFKQNIEIIYKKESILTKVKKLFI